MIDFDLLCKISEYSKKHSISSLDLYIKRGARSEKEVYLNCLNGKIAEYNAYYFLLSKGYDLEEPDLEIYDEPNKNYDADLTYKGNKLHIKSYDPYKYTNVPPSVTFTIFDPVYTEAPCNNYIVPMIKTSFLIYDLWGFIPATDAAYKDLVYPKPTKKALYLSDHVKYRLKKS